MVGELQVLVISAGAAALVAKDHLCQIPMKARLVRAETLHKRGDIEHDMAPAGEEVDRHACPGLQLLA
ncbi:hypothetical protein EN745_09830 [Mesorhizobium sp. M4A.F.Ca.ET.022.05.2.1]|nr:hypothetical protein EN745_09830 [Mesorhizobium sp. M4A.F.Ca.ET.022.05.2.1]